MTERARQVEALRAYARQLADLMTLKDWQVVVEEEHADDGNNAQVHVTYGQQHARIWVSAKFFEKTAEERRYVLAHELLHCHFDMAERLAKPGMKKSAQAGLRLAIEIGVDNVARALAPHLPLPLAGPLHDA